MDSIIVILAGGVSSRMKGSHAQESGIDGEILRDVREKAKAMIRVGPGSRPFMDFCLLNIATAGYTEVVIVTGERDLSITNYYELGGRARDFPSLSLSYVVQKVPPGREKPLGTADALLTVLRERPGWKGKRITVCNSDNLYSIGALKKLMAETHPNALIDYDRDALGFPPERTSQFAVIVTDGEGFVKTIVEKPGPAEIEAATGPAGRVGVSMNIFRLSYGDIVPYLESVPLHPDRGEKELPVAVRMMAEERPGSVYAIRLSERVPDLTRLADIPEVQKYLSAGIR